jgi:hypothetical protein
VRILLRVTPFATWDISLFGLIRRQFPKAGFELVTYLRRFFIRCAMRATEFRHRKIKFQKNNRLPSYYYHNHNVNCYTKSNMHYKFIMYCEQVKIYFQFPQSAELYPSGLGYTK